MFKNSIKVIPQITEITPVPIAISARVLNSVSVTVASVTTSDFFGSVAGATYPLDNPLRATIGAEPPADGTVFDVK